ncbi:MAG: metallophosphoesterase family protein, partial [Chloroflexi bacterium]|nr:metallophosphoesterase family protein [Chloroflexota bacterium]
NSNFALDETWVLGDLVGYGPNPEECLSLLDSIGAIAVAGNHDLATIGDISTNMFNPVAAAAVEWTKNNLESRYLDQLKMLPTRLERHGFTLVHGSPSDRLWEYVLDERSAARALHAIDTRGLAVGHTHYQAVFELKDEKVYRVEVETSSFHELSGDRFLVNPGSVGQPRDANPRAGYAVLDLDQNAIWHRRVTYDAELTATRIQEVGLPVILGNRLLRGF